MRRRIRVKRRSGRMKGVDKHEDTARTSSGSIDEDANKNNDKNSNKRMDDERDT